MHRPTELSGSRRGRRFLGIFTIWLVAIALMAMTLPSLALDAVGGEPFDRHKFGIMFGGGYGRVSIGEAGVFGETSSTPDEFSMGMAFAFEYAYRTDKRFSVEGFATMWMGTLNGDLGNEDWIVSVIGGGFRWRPTGEGFYFRGGFGASVVSASLVDPQSDEYESEYTDVGLGVVGTLGYDVRIARTFAAGPRIEAIAVDVGEGVTATAVNLLFTFTF